MAKAGLGWYLDHITETDLLTHEQEQDLSRRIRQDQDPAAREQMIQANLRLVVNIAKQFADRGMPLSDLVAEGNIGLMRAVEEFDPDEGVRFSTYAAWWIKQALKRALINAVQPVRIPDYMVQQVSKWHKAKRDLEEELGRPPSTEEIAKKLHISQKKAAMICQGILAVNSPTQLPSDETQSMAEMFSADQTDPTALFEDEGNTTVVRKLLEQLPERQRDILTYRFGLDGHEGPQRTFKEVGKLVGLTRERARQLEKEALARLQTLLDEIW
ncbi:MAG: sigma-70 family RNA polymerase sigma factor [Phycisphaerae bacterium]|nr:sigma-70 family RNA polymerase sigma factor [Phycisphaerae bacterium]